MIEQCLILKEEPIKKETESQSAFVEYSLPFAHFHAGRRREKKKSFLLFEMIVRHVAQHIRQRQRFRLWSQARSLITLPWAPSPALSRLQSVSEDSFAALGKAAAQEALTYDAGPAAHAECLKARQQLEFIVQSYTSSDMSIKIFGGVGVLGLVEPEGDVDFVGVADVEPSADEAANIVSELSRELRRLGLKASCVPRARIPIVRVERASREVTGTPVGTAGLSAFFQFSRTMESREQEAFCRWLATYFSCSSVEWSSMGNTATASFPDTDSLIKAISEASKFDDASIPLRQPVNVRLGPELYRFPFDLCLSTLGLQNSKLLGRALEQYPFAPHMLLLLKRWAKACGVVSTVDGLLASYAITNMLTHFLVSLGVVPNVSSFTPLVPEEPRLVSHNLQYRPLAQPQTREEMATLGQLLAAYFVYYSEVFKYEEDVVCPSNPTVKKTALKWVSPPEIGYASPPFYHFAIKDPYGVENIARNLDLRRTTFVRKAHLEAAGVVEVALESGAPIETFTKLLHKDRKLAARGPSPSVAAVSMNTDVPLSPEQESWRMWKQQAAYRRHDRQAKFGSVAVATSERTKKAQDMAQSVLQWMRRASPAVPSQEATPEPQSADSQNQNKGT